MSYTNCMGCNKIINYKSGPVLCKQCDEKIFKIIKEYLNENPASDAKKISEETKVPLKIIKSFLQDKRLEIIRTDVVKCILCGDIAIDDSKYCPKCLKKVNAINELNKLCFEEKNEYSEENNRRNGMHYYGTKRR